MNLELETYHLKRLIEGDTTSFDAIFIHYHPIVLRFLVGFIKDKEQAQDIAQDIFCKLWISHDRLGHIQSLKSYLFKMCRNAVYDSFDRQIAEQNYLSHLEETAPQSTSVEHEIYAKFNMSRKEGLSNDEIALRLNLKKNTVEKTISFVLTQLKKNMLTALLFLIP
jgi:RNA polymerase sigma-70 factor (ECF subfamily)